MRSKLFCFFCFFLFTGIDSFCRQMLPQPESYLRDSLTQHDREFRYMKNIDSLLRSVNHEADSLNRSMIYGTGEKESGISRFIAAFFGNGFIQILFWSILGIFILFIIYRLFDFNSFSSGKKKETREAMTEMGDLKESLWYMKKIAEAEKNGDLILAVRYRFLNLLSALDKKGIIQFIPEKSNEAYVSEIREAGTREQFSRLKNIYEHIWYGKRRIDAIAYAEVSSYFTQYEKSI